jgi:AraC-like DNA-binding protein
MQRGIGEWECGVKGRSRFLLSRPWWLDKCVFMRLVRPEQSWHILSPSRSGQLCLQSLSLRFGYRVCELCAELECGERYFYEVFTRDVGLAPKIWMRQERMVVARRMLTGGRTPEEVSAALGFSSANNFRREFLAFYQVPPLRFQAEQWGQRCRID